MASQYITFIIIFTLGLAMVVVTNNMFTMISEQFRLNIAKYEMTEILEEVEMQIIQNTLLSSSFNQTINQRIDLPINLAQGYGYRIRISNSSDNMIILSGITFNEKIIQMRSFKINSIYSIESNGIFQSTSSVLIINIVKIGNQISIIIS